MELNTPDFDFLYQWLELPLGDVVDLKSFAQSLGGLDPSLFSEDEA